MINYEFAVISAVLCDGVNGSCFLFTCADRCGFRSDGLGTLVSSVHSLSRRRERERCRPRFGSQQDAIAAGHQVRAESGAPPLRPPPPPAAHPAPPLPLITSDTMPIPQWAAFTALFIDEAAERLYQVARNSGHLKMSCIHTAALRSNICFDIVSQVNQKVNYRQGDP